MPTHVDIADVAFRYGASKFGFEHVSLCVGAGARLAVTGGNGTGKTTLLELACGLREPLSGKVTRSRGMAYVPVEVSHFLLPWYSVQRNLDFYAELGGMSAANEPAIVPLLQVVGTSRDDLAARKVYEISRGQQSALALVCALLLRPDVLVLDELFANLSGSAANAVADIIAKWVGTEKACIFTSHAESVRERLATTYFDIEQHALKGHRAH